MGTEGGPSAKDMGKDMGLRHEETRILSDAELIKGGARFAKGGRLEITRDQIELAEVEAQANKFFDSGDSGVNPYTGVIDPGKENIKAETSQKLREYFGNNKEALLALDLHTLMDPNTTDDMLSTIINPLNDRFGPKDKYGFPDEFNRSQVEVLRVKLPNQRTLEITIYKSIFQEKDSPALFRWTY